MPSALSLGYTRTQGEKDMLCLYVARFKRAKGHRTGYDSAAAVS